MATIEIILSFFSFGFFNKLLQPNANPTMGIRSGTDVKKDTTQSNNAILLKGIICYF